MLIESSVMTIYVRLLSIDKLKHFGASLLVIYKLAALTKRSWNHSNLGIQASLRHEPEPLRKSVLN